MEKKPCVRCGRLVDPVARLCPYCNWDQELAPPPADAPPPAFVDDRPDPATQQRRRMIRRVLFAAGVVILLIGTFVVGGLVLQIGKSAADRKPTEQLPGREEGRGGAGNRAVTDLTLVSVDPTSTVGRSITSAPPVNPTGEVIGTDRPDLTALALQQYSEVARRAAEEEPREEGGPTLDPRTIRPEPVAPPRPVSTPPTSTARLPEPAGTATAEPRPSAAREPAPTAPPPDRPERAESRRTRPRAISQPLPDLNVDGTARFRLRIAADGSVREVEVLQTIPGSTAQLVSAIQGWRFEPATENGRPVEGTHIVDVSFHARNDEE